MPKGFKAGGRQKGTPNKVSAQVKENVLCVFTRLGGTHAMAEWAKEHPTQFYQLYAKLLPTESEVTVIQGEARELTDDELHAIASGSGTAEATEGESIASRVH